MSSALLRRKSSDGCNMSSWSVALMPTILSVDSCSQLVRCVRDTNTSYFSSSSPRRWYPAVYKAQILGLVVYLGPWMFAFICMFHEDCGPNEWWHHSLWTLTYSLGTVLMTPTTSCLLGDFNGFTVVLRRMYCDLINSVQVSSRPFNNICLINDLHRASITLISTFLYLPP